MKLKNFENLDNFYTGLKRLFNSLNVPVNYIDEKPLNPNDILLNTYKEKNPAYLLMDDVYVLGMVDDKAFKTPLPAASPLQKGRCYDGILIFGVTLKRRESDLLPTRSQLAEITRAFNREFYYTPVVVVFRYENFISLANAERLKYKQEWREGEKTGKVSILRDVDIANPHTGHLKILEALKITRSGKKGINSFEDLYKYWQEVFSVSLLSKKFYSDLSNWYFWAIKHVTFPSEPTIESFYKKTGSTDNSKLEAVKQEFKAKNVIRLLTRLLFVWFIKEKKLIPEELFDLEALQKNILKKISPFHYEDSLFKEENKESTYYKTILQNLFFATLNCPIKPDSADSRERGFRGDESYGKHRGIDYLMRYKKYFKDPDAFLQKVNSVVPFLNGGLFECLDDKENKIYIDGFSDNMSKTKEGKRNHLIVPDYLFFGREEKTDLSDEYGIKSKGVKEASVKGLINILKSYKFTIAENTPIEEDVALDPELLGKVFENLLASYNPETKTTARKQTGSFYTPREIVNYMVDESLIAHLKNTISSSPDTGEVSEGRRGRQRGRQSGNKTINNLPHLKTFRKKLRNNLTPAEAKLWTLLKGKKLKSRKFRRQHSVSTYILDFYCPSEKLAVELDGQGHFEAAQAEYDYERDLFLKHVGIKVLRFENKLVWDNPDYLLREIERNFNWDQLASQIPPLSRGGAGSGGVLLPPRQTSSATPPLKGGVLLDEQLHKLLSFEPVNPFENNPELSKKIIHSLDNCKILDPACGSGAFPMGILQKMVHILQKLDPENEYWQDLQQEKAIKETEGVFVIKDKEEKKQLLVEINEAFDETVNNPDYARKLFLIENCIYGVDIQPIATQISKLRFFISLVVEQNPSVIKDDSSPLEVEQLQEKNFGIRPLPNLETKFVTANTLIGIDKPKAKLNFSDTKAVKSLEQELKTIRHKLFGAKTKATKIKYRKRDEELRNEIADILKKGNLPVESAEQMAKWDPYDQNGVSPFFDPEWMFDVKDGFDVVIGNPPYVQIQKFSGQQCQKEWENQNYKTYAKTGDIYSLFYERGDRLLKKGGHLCFITSNKWMRANYGKATRKYFAQNTTPLKLIDFGGYKVFESATVDTNILILKKPDNNNNNNNNNRLSSCEGGVPEGGGGLKACTVGKNFTDKTNIAEYLDKNSVLLKNLSEESWIICSREEYAIKKRIEKVGIPLKEWDIKISYGIRTGFNEAFIISGSKKDELIAKDPKNAEIIKPILRGRDIKRYKTEFADLWLIVVKKGFHEEFKTNYSLLYEFVAKFKKELNNRGQVRANSHHWIEIDNSPTNTYLKEFEKEKIVYPNMTQKPCFAYSNTITYSNDKSFILTSAQISIKYLLAYLNSSITDFMLRQLCSGLGLKGLEVRKVFIENLPIPQISKEKQLPFEILVDCILFAKENDMESEADTFESVINGMVYDLYFEEDMKKAHCYITDRIADVIKPFRDDDSDEFKTAYIKKLHYFCRNDKIVFHGIIHRRNIKMIKIINGDYK